MKNKKSHKKISEFLLNFDIFGQHIQLTFKGNYKYKITFGTMMSISFFVLIMILTAEALIDVYTKKIVSIDRYTERFDPSGVTYNSAYHGFTI